MTFEAGLSRRSLSLADRKILIRRVYRRACASPSEPTADRGLPTQAPAVGGRDTRARRWSWRRPPIYPLDKDFPVRGSRHQPAEAGSQIH